MTQRVDPQLLFYMRSEGVSVKRITLAGAKPSTPKREIIDPDRRVFMLRHVRHLIRTWKTTPFEEEGNIVAAIRSMLCLEGIRFDDADSEARALFREALRALGVHRPSWEMGQREYVGDAHRCQCCNAELPEGSSTGNKRTRYCSVRCAEGKIAAIKAREEASQSWTRTHAYYVIRRAKTEPRACRHCSKDFHPKSANDPALYCSTACSGESRKIMEIRTCFHCKEEFKPRSVSAESKGKFCSKACSYAHGSTSQFLCSCVECSVTFMAKKPEAIYCTAACKKVADNRRRKQKRRSGPDLNVIYLTAALFDRTFGGSANLRTRPPENIMTENIFDRLFA